MRAAFGGSPLPRLAGLDGGLKAGIDVSPMTGLVLVLLIVVMVVTPSFVCFTDYPTALSGVVIRDGGITLGVDRDGHYYLDDRRIPEVELAAGLRRAFAARPAETTLYLKSHDDVEYARVLDVLDAARDARVRRMIAVVERPR